MVFWLELNALARLCQLHESVQLFGGRRRDWSSWSKLGELTTQNLFSGPGCKFAFIDHRHKASLGR